MKNLYKIICAVTTLEQIKKFLSLSNIHSQVYTWEFIYCGKDNINKINLNSKLSYKFIQLKDIPFPSPPCHCHPHESASWLLHNAVQGKNADILYFEETLGFHCIQAKRTLGEYTKTLLVCGLTQNFLPTNPLIPLRETRREFNISYVLTNADIILANEFSLIEQIPFPKKFIFEKLFYLQDCNELSIKDLYAQLPSSPPSYPLPTLSVCMAHYNHARYLPWALDSLEQQTYPDFEVIVTDDGSTDAEARKVFTEQERRRDARFRFFRKENSGPGETRNFCAAQATGDCLVFMDADNLAAPGMLRTFAEAMARTQVDALTCHFEAFPADYIGLMPPRRLYRSAPTGQDLVTGLLENMFGDTNMAVRSSVFRALGGMHPTRTGVEDWEFLARLGLTGHTQDVIPETLFYYRLTPEGISRNNAHMNTLECIYGTYKRYGLHEDLAQKLIERFLFPYHKLAMDGNLLVTESVFLRQAVRIGLFLEKLYQNLCPTGSKRQRFFTTCRHFHQKVFLNKTPSPSSFS